MAVLAFGLWCELPLLAASLLLAMSPRAAALDPVPTYENFAAPLVAKYCADCHVGDAAEAGIDFDQLAKGDDFQRDRANWKLIAQRLRTGDMPPPDSPQPTAEERDSLVVWLDSRLAELRCDRRSDPGHVTLRRLNREQYRRTIHDLLGVDFDPTATFPPDDLAYGFDNNGDVLSISPALLEKYLAAAEEIARRALPAPEQVREPRRSLPLEDASGGQPAEGRVGLFYSGTCEWTFKPRGAGLHVVHFRLSATQGGDEPVRVRLHHQGQPVVETSVLADEGENETLTAVVDCTDDEQSIGVEFLNDYFQPATGDGAAGDRNLLIEGVEVVGPIAANARTIPQATGRLLGAVPSLSEWRGPDKAWRATASDALLRFTRLAYRRPTSATDIEPLLQLVEQARDEGQSYEQAIQFALTAVLSSPRFLLVGLPTVAATMPAEPGYRLDGTSIPVRLVDEYELATRLSYFLWSSTPDAALLDLADRGELRASLDDQLRRMLRDSRSKSLGDVFAAQWLQSRRLASLAPDEQLFPEFTPRLRQAMQEEVSAYFNDLVRNDLPITMLLDSDFTYLNQALAEFYGVPGVRGQRLRRVEFPPELAGVRGGVLGMAAMLTVTSYPNRTSPVLRGKFLLGELLGDEPPPPPAGVSDLPTGAAVSHLSLRERLAMHRVDPTCAVCHVRMDPLGLALEEFDAIGRHRREDQGQPLDLTGKLPDGQEFVGVAGLKQVLLARQDDFRRTLAEKLLTFALGRGVEDDDTCAIVNICEQTRAQGDTLRALLAAVVASDPFQYQRVADNTASEEN